MSMVEEQDRIVAMLEEGATVDDVEEDVIDGAPCDEDAKAGLWLFAWSSVPQCRRRGGRRLVPIDSA
jgi:hypothetical protein